MKAAIHPTYYATAITCACGNVLQTGSVQESISVELCSACHPFYTGQQKILDTARRVEKYTDRAAKAQTSAAIGHAAKLEKKAARAKARQEKREKSEMAQ